VTRNPEDYTPPKNTKLAVDWTQRRYGKGFATPTEYEGVEFKTALEARWAEEFDKAEVPWLYEPITYRRLYRKKNKGIFSVIYTPDFWIGPEGRWVVVETKAYGVPVANAYHIVELPLLFIFGYPDDVQGNQMVLRVSGKNYDYGADWLAAFRDIQTAIDVPYEGDPLWVREHKRIRIDHG